MAHALRSKNNELNTGGLASEDRRCVRQGELSWVPAFEKNVNFRLWFFQFKIGAETYLNQDVYPDAKGRRYGFLNALMRAASLGRNDGLLIDLELYDSAGIYCEALLEKIKQKYMPKDALLRVKMSEEFFNFKREGKLGESVERLNMPVLECRKARYEPDDATLQLKYRVLLRKEEVPMFEVYLSKDTGTQEDEASAEKTRRVLELLALDKEGISSKQDAVGFCGGAFREGPKSGKRHSHHGKRQDNPRRAGFGGGGHSEQKVANQSECKKCGKAGCKSMSSKDQNDCPANKFKCNGCGQKGHWFKCCPKQNKQHNQKARVNFAEAEDHEEGCDSIPPGFQGCQPKA